MSTCFSVRGSCCAPTICAGLKHCQFSDPEPANTYGVAYTRDFGDFATENVMDWIERELERCNTPAIGSGMVADQDVGDALRWLRANLFGIKEPGQFTQGLKAAEIRQPTNKEDAAAGNIAAIKHVAYAEGYEAGKAAFLSEREAEIKRILQLADFYRWQTDNIGNAARDELEAAVRAALAHPSQEPWRIQHATDLTQPPPAISHAQSVAALQLLREVRYSAERHQLPRKWLDDADRVLGTWKPVELLAQSPQ